MKPSTISEKKTSPAEYSQTEVREKTPRRKLYILTGVIAFVLVAGTVILSVHFGMKITKDSYKEYQATYVEDIGTAVHEKVVVTDSEEVFSSNVGTCVADFSTGLITVKIKESEFPVDECYVTNMNFSDFQSPMKFKRTHTASQITFETKNMVRRVYEATDIRLNNKALGTRSAELCKGKSAIFLREKKDDPATREKRGSWSMPYLFAGNSMFRFK
ncbi:uncharacterized protein LOC123563760 [Mercenaria mercenaria]|uniref:uncharacterized protein LOC123563760 n=1 Tax=Mercenaria mercenaria TaxID=6596 RepID=UPI001E1DA54E|nr:uncharacterized protein LOC123563760 [Mercenaria mercenaria]XP_045212704.1 uncharacterized protein LOC123563760 [Mercenaria mercenaria]